MIAASILYLIALAPSPHAATAWSNTAPVASERFTVGLAVAGPSLPVTPTGTATGTIADNDTTSAPPTISSVAITSTPSFDADGDGTAETYLLGEHIDVTVTWSADVVWDVSAEGAQLRLRLDVDGHSNTTRQAGLVTGGATSGTARSLVFRYTVAPRDRDTDGVYPKPSGTGNLVHLISGATLKDAQGQDASRVHGGLSADPGHQVDGREDRTAAAVTISDASAEEGDDITFTVTLDKAVAGGFTVTPSFVDGTATEGTDYTANTAGISFAGTAGETQTFTVATTEDSDVEDDETFRVRLSVSGTSETVTATSRATGTIRNDDVTPAPPTITSVAITSTPSFDADGDGTAETYLHRENIDVTVTWSADVAWDVSAEGAELRLRLDVDGPSNTTKLAGLVTGGATGGTARSLVFRYAVAPRDRDTDGVYPKPSGTGNLVHLISGATLKDAHGQDASRAHGGLSADPNHQVDGTPAVVTIADASADEGDDITFTVTLDKPVAGGFTVTPSYTDRTATEGTDYTANTDGISFAGTAGETQTFTVATTEDSDVEDDETFTVGLSVSGTSANVTATSTATGTIRNDDETPAVVTVADASADEGDNITFTVTLDRAVAGGFTVTPRFTDGTATEGTDYTANTAGISFAGNAGETQTLTVATIEDSEEEDDETFTVGLSVSGTSANVTAMSTATGTIRNDDETPAPPTISSVAITSTPSFDADGDGTAETYLLGEHIEVTVTWSADVVWDVSADGAELRLRLDVDGQQNTTKLARLVTGGATSGTARSLVFRYAVAPRDRDTDGVYPKPSGTGNLVHLVSGATLKDAHGQEASRAHGGLSADPSHQVDGREDRTAAAVTISDAAAEEGDDLTFTVTLDKAVAGGFTVTPSFVDETATEGEDYTANTAAIDFAGDAGETQTFAVATTDDTDVEDDETFRVRLRVSGTSETVTATSRATGTIRDDDETPPPPTISSVAITSTPSYDADGDGRAETYLHRENIDVTVTWSADVVWDVSAEGAELRLRLDVDGESNAARLARLVTGGATSGTARSLVFRYAVRPRDRDTDGVFPTPIANGNLVHLISGATLKDTHGQDASLAHGGLPADPRHQVDGGAGTAAPAVTIADASADEGDEITFTVTLDRAVAGGFTVTPSFVDETATEGEDYTANTAATDFAGDAGETQTFAVATTGDTDVEDDETFTVGLSVSGTSGTVTATSTATGTIRDDDTPSTGLTLSVSPFWIAEDGADTTVTVIAALDADALDADVAVTVSVGDTADAATEGTDYQTVNDFVMTIAAGNVADTGSFLLAPTNDDLVEGEETISVSGSATGLAVAGAEVFIVDDEGGGVTGTSSPTFGGAAVENQSYALGTAITDLVLPEAAGGAGSLTYALSPDPPAGLTFTASTRTLSGTPTAGRAATRYTYTATGSDAAADSIEFTIAVTYGCAGSWAAYQVTAGGIVRDCEALLASEATLVGTGIALNWDTGTRIADWVGVGGNYAGRVTSIALARRSLGGSIPAELGNLSELTTLSLHDNALTGSIPAELGNLSNLASLGLSNNALTSSIPAELGNLSELTTLLLHGNALTGPIPAELDDLSSLRWLSLNHNQLTGCIQLPLRRFYHNINPQKSSVRLPLCLGVPMLTLAGGNGQITAAWTVPAGGTPTGYDVEYKLASDTAWTDAGQTGTDTTATIGSLTNRSEYHVRVRAKTATDTGEWSAVATGTPSTNPPDFGTATVANQTYTPNEAIMDLVLPAATGGEGTVTYALSPNPPPGLSFNAGTRTLSGTPTTGHSAAYVYTATDADNNADALTFTIAVTFGCSGAAAVGGPSVTSGGLVDDCEALLSSEAALVGTGDPLNWDLGTHMSDWEWVTLLGGRVTALSSLNDHNRLAGSIPAALGDLSNLRELRLGTHDLTGTIPRELGNLPNLTALQLESNALTGTIPRELGNLSNLTQLILSRNDLSGAIPPELRMIL